MPILVEKRPSGIARVTIDRQHVLNALDVPAKEQLAAAWRDLASDDTIRAIILTGAGERAFCAGSDIKEIARTGTMVSTQALVEAIPGVGIRLDKPVIAALHGYCIGMGMTLAIHCDLRLAAPNTIFGYPEVRHGMISAVSAMRLGEIIPQVHANEMMLMAQNIDVAKASSIGLINGVFEDVQATADAWAERMAGFPAIGVQTTKRLASFPRRATYAAALAEIQASRDAVESVDDFKEGAQAHERAQTHKRA